MPSNSPAVNSLWLPAIALKTPVVIKPGKEEPWTPYRLIQAFIAAGVPAEAFGFYPTDHEGAAALLKASDPELGANAVRLTSGETDWAYSGTAWWSPGQATALGANNITYLTNGAPYVAAKAGVASLSFTHRHSFEVDWDGGVVQVSINGGPFTTVPKRSTSGSGESSLS